jgi:hypothetical protein
MSRNNGVDYNNDRFLMFGMDLQAYELEKRAYDVIRLTLGKSEM